MTTLCFGMKRAGMTNRQIAARLGVTEGQVARKCKGRVRKSLTGRANGVGRPSRVVATMLTMEEREDL